MFAPAHPSSSSRLAPRLAVAVCVALGAASLVGVLAGADDDIAVHSTEFDSAADLDGWSEHAPDGFAAKWAPPRVENGALVLEPVSSGWYEDMQAGHLYKEITGDFIVTAAMDVRGLTGPTPQTGFSLAGLFVRAPLAVSAETWEPGRENWLFVSVGTASPAGAPQYEIKTTYNSLSTLKILPREPGPVQLRLARQGELFTVLHKPDGAPSWVVLDQIIRPDLPQTVNVGLTAYSDYANAGASYPDFVDYNVNGAATNGADLIAHVDRIEFRRPVIGRFPIANIDAPATFGAAMIEARRADLFAD